MARWEAYSLVWPLTIGSEALCHLREVVLADVAQGGEEAIERLLQRLTLSPRKLLHLRKFSLGKALAREVLKLLKGNQRREKITEAHR